MLTTTGAAGRIRVPDGLGGWRYMTPEELMPGVPVYVGPTLPADPGAAYIWFQTGLGTHGDEMTLLIEGV